MKTRQQRLYPFLAALATWALLAAPARAQTVTGTNQTAAEQFAESSQLNLPVMLPAPPTTADATITTPSFALPFSYFASSEARAAFLQSRQMYASSSGAAPEPPRDMLALRQMLAPIYQMRVQAIAQRFPYASQRTEMGGVRVEIVTPIAGVERRNRNRVLINLHGGGGFLGGGGPGGVIESAPIAHFGRIKVIAVDYRQAPEASHPAALQDVEAVYRQLLRDYRPENIGIYGCSSGGYFTAQTVAWFEHQGLPQPGALGVFCSSMFPADLGDSSYTAQYLNGGVTPRGGPLPETLSPPYFGGQSSADPLVNPAAAPDEVLAAFPPTLFLTGSRAPEMSAAAQSNILLRQHGVRSEFILFDGVGHGFFTGGDTPEAEAALRLIVQFFNDHLGQRR